MVLRAGLEPATSCFASTRSVQLIYRSEIREAASNAGKKEENRLADKVDFRSAQAGNRGCRGKWRNMELHSVSTPPHFNYLPHDED